MRDTATGLGLQVETAASLTDARHAVHRDLDPRRHGGRCARRTRNLHDTLRRVEQLYRETTDLLASALEARDGGHAPAHTVRGAY